MLPIRTHSILATGKKHRRVVLKNMVVDLKMSCCSWKIIDKENSSSAESRRNTPVDIERWSWKKKHEKWLMMNDQSFISSTFVFTPLLFLIPRQRQFVFILYSPKALFPTPNTSFFNFQDKRHFQPIPSDYPIHFNSFFLFYFFLSSFPSSFHLKFL